MPFWAIGGAAERDDDPRAIWTRRAAHYDNPQQPHMRSLEIGQNASRDYGVKSFSLVAIKEGADERHAIGYRSFVVAAERRIIHRSIR